MLGAYAHAEIRFRALREHFRPIKVASDVRPSTAWRAPLCDEQLLAGRKLFVALGKFDAMHVGHRSLAEAAAATGGYPCLLSFWGMAEVLNLPPRKPLTADKDRSRVLRLWQPHCDGLVPLQRSIPFHEIRTLDPEGFVKLLVHELGVGGVVVGENYRFGYRARGNTQMLQELGVKLGLSTVVLPLRSKCEGADDSGTCVSVSSTRVRGCLASGSMLEAAVCLDRPYSLLVPSTAFQPQESHTAESALADGVLEFAREDALNQVPCNGVYDVKLHNVTDTDIRGETGVEAQLIVLGDQCRISGASLGAFINADCVRAEIVSDVQQLYSA